MSFSLNQSINPTKLKVTNYTDFFFTKRFHVLSTHQKSISHFKIYQDKIKRREVFSQIKNVQPELKTRHVLEHKTY